MSKATASVLRSGPREMMTSDNRTNPFRPIEQLIGLGLAATTAAELAPDLGSIAQRYLTTAIPFNLAIENITRTRDVWGRDAHFVKVGWQE